MKPYEVARSDGQPIAYWNERARDWGYIQPPADSARRSKTACWRRGARTQRKPLFLFLLSGLFLFRFADRRFSAELLKEPPRSERPQQHFIRTRYGYDAFSRARCQPPSWRPMRSV
jgi:hypothetical protein